MAKRGPKLTRNMKEFMTRKLGIINPDDYMCIKNTEIEFVIRNKVTNQIIPIHKEDYASITF